MDNKNQGHHCGSRSIASSYTIFIQHCCVAFPNQSQADYAQFPCLLDTHKHQCCLLTLETNFKAVSMRLVLLLEYTKRRASLGSLPYMEYRKQTTVPSVGPNQGIALQCNSNMYAVTCNSLLHSIVAKRRHWAKLNNPVLKR